MAAIPKWCTFFIRPGKEQQAPKISFWVPERWEMIKIRVGNFLMFVLVLLFLVLLGFFHCSFFPPTFPRLSPLSSSSWLFSLPLTPFPLKFFHPVLNHELQLWHSLEAQLQAEEKAKNWEKVHFFLNWVHSKQLVQLFFFFFLTYILIPKSLRKREVFSSSLVQDENQKFLI